MDDSCFTDIVIRITGALELIVEIDVFGVHEVIFTEHSDFSEDLPPEQHAGARDNLDLEQFHVIREKWRDSPEGRMRPAQPQIFRIHNLIQDSRELLDGAELDGKIGIQKFASDNAKIG